MTKVFVVPKPGAIVRDPNTKQALPAGGAVKPATSYWLRRLKDLSVTVGTAPATSAGPTATPVVLKVVPPANSGGAPATTPAPAKPAVAGTRPPVVWKPGGVPAHTGVQRHPVQTQMATAATLARDTAANASAAVIAADEAKVHTDVAATPAPTTTSATPAAPAPAATPAPAAPAPTKAS
jgi:hypothetical protein